MDQQHHFRGKTLKHTTSGGSGLLAEKRDRQRRFRSEVKALFSDLRSVLGIDPATTTKDTLTVTIATLTDLRTALAAATLRSSSSPLSPGASTPATYPCDIPPASSASSGPIDLLPLPTLLAHHASANPFPFFPTPPFSHPPDDPLLHSESVSPDFPPDLVPLPPCDTDDFAAAGLVGMDLQSPSLAHHAHEAHDQAFASFSSFAAPETLFMDAVPEVATPPQELQRRSAPPAPASAPPPAPASVPLPSRTPRSVVHPRGGGGGGGRGAGMPHARSTDRRSMRAKKGRAAGPGRPTSSKLTSLLSSAEKEESGQQSAVHRRRSASRRRESRVGPTPRDAAQAEHAAGHHSDAADEADSGDYESDLAAGVAALRVTATADDDDDDTLGDTLSDLSTSATSAADDDIAFFDAVVDVFASDCPSSDDA